MLVFIIINEMDLEIPLPFVQYIISKVTENINQ